MGEEALQLGGRAVSLLRCISSASIDRCADPVRPSFCARCLFKDVEERSFMQQQDSIANVLRGGAGRKWFIKSDRAFRLALPL